MGPFGESLKEFALVIIDLVLEQYPTWKKESLGTLVYDLHPLKYDSYSYKVSFIPQRELW